VWLPSCPDCQEIDRNPEWHRWLLGADALTGRPWQVLLNDAIAKGNAARVSAFFRFRQEAGGVQSPLAAPRHAALGLRKADQRCTLRIETET